MEEDPFFYRKLSALLEQSIADYKAERICEAEYLAKVTEILEEVRGGNVKDVPAVLKENDFSRALFGELKTQINTQPSADTTEDDGVVREDAPAYGADIPPRKPAADEVLAEAACEMEKIIRRHNVVRWRENVDAQNRMRNDLDDFLFDLQKEKAIVLNFVQMDAIIENVIRIAMHRTDDV
jgi:type I restriction enzyme R subunit